jgi:protein SCO1
MTRGFPVLLGLVLSIGMAALAFETDGFRVVTSAGARQVAVERRPLPLPDVRLRDQNGSIFSLGDYRGRPLLVDFIYTRCPTLCSERGDDFRRMMELANSSGAQIDFVSISFDPESDDSEALRLYADRYGAAPRWRVAAPADARSLRALLQSFDVVVIPDGMGGYIHNSAIYVVDARGRLVRILDPDAPQRIFAGAMQAVSP